MQTFVLFVLAVLLGSAAFYCAIKLSQPPERFDYFCTYLCTKSNGREWSVGWQVVRLQAPPENYGELQDWIKEGFNGLEHWDSVTLTNVPVRNPKILRGEQ